METEHVLEQAKKTIEDLSTIIWEHAGLSTSDETEATLSAINESLQPATTGRGHSIDHDKRCIDACRKSLQDGFNHVWLIENKDVQEMVGQISVLMKRCEELSHSIDEALTLKV